MITFIRTPDGVRYLIDENRLPVRVGDTIEGRFGHMVIRDVVFEEAVYMLVSPAESSHVFRARAADLWPLHIVDGPDLERRRQAQLIGCGEWTLHGVGPMDMEWEIPAMIVPPLVAS